MPKIGASLANVSTEFIPVEPDLYHIIHEKPDYSKGDDGRVVVTVNAKILSGEETGADSAGRIIKDRIHLHKKDKTENEFGQIQLKRYVEAAIPESKDWDEARWDDFDTDELAGTESQLAVIIETYEDELPGGQKEEKKTNRVKRVLSV